MLPSADFLFHYSSDAVIVLDPTGVVCEANPRTESLLLASRDDILGAPLASLLPDFAGSRAEGQVRELSGTALERRIDHFSPTRYTWYEIRMVTVAEMTVLFLRDVTDRMRQARTEAVREAVRQIVLDAPVAISITRGADHRYELVNNFAKRLIGNREIEGRTARSVFPEVDPALFAILDDVYVNGKSVTMKDLEVAFDREATGTLTRGTFDVTYQPLIDSDGTCSGILSVSVETTEYAAERRRVADRGVTP